MALARRLLGLGPAKGGEIAVCTGDQGDQEDVSGPRKRTRKLRPRMEISQVFCFDPQGVE
jgi:hypothetical protein